MKIGRLILEAFGPFTHETLDFVNTPANLHLIYGPNEAGKSSALRAMTDLRFGIPTRSADNFLHASADLRISAIFIDDDGNEIGLVRRKGRKDTLSRFDISAGPYELTTLPEPGLVRALTSGLQRQEFELMFGLDHERLRTGGKNLLEGEGELGSALFEASAGTQGIAVLLEQLDGDAKRYFNPHARSHNAIINGARTAIDTARRELRAAQTKPNDWHKLYRAHEEAKTQLADVSAELETLRRRAVELTELRAIEPLVKRLDLATESLTLFATGPDLPDGARERRLAAQQALTRAGKDQLEARNDLERCTDALRPLQVDPALLEHATAVERLVAAVDSTSRARVEARQRQALVSGTEQDLKTKLARIDPALTMDEILAAMPSEADKLSLAQRLATLDSLQQRASALAAQMSSLDEQLSVHASESAPRIDDSQRQRVERSLHQAQALGNVRQRLNDFDQQISTAAAEVRQRLPELGQASVDALKRTCPLLESEIGQAREELALTRSEIDRHIDTEEKLKIDLGEQRLRERKLAASGELINAESLKAAREHRDAGWTLIRKAFIELTVDPAAVGPTFDDRHALPEAFEIAQRESDRQADMLGADAERAALLTESMTRIEQMEAALEKSTASLTQLRARSAELQGEWKAKLSRAILPDLEIDALEEWQTKRARVLEVQDHLDSLCARRDDSLEAARLVLEKLHQAMREAGAPTSLPVGTDADGDLDAAMTQAAQLIRSSLEQDATDAERERNRQRAVAERAKYAIDSAKATDEIEQHSRALEKWLERIRLRGDLDISEFKARLAELEVIAKAEASLCDERRQLASHKSLVIEFAERAAVLATLLNQDAPDDPEDFADRMHQRLLGAREVAQQRKDLMRDQQSAEQRMRVAKEEQQIHSADLEKLCRAAGVVAAQDLPDLESASMQKKTLLEQVTQIREQIAEVSNIAESELRARLANLDAAAINTALEQTQSKVAIQEDAQNLARRAEEESRHGLAAVDDSGLAAAASESIEAAAARFRAALRPWARLRLGHALLAAALVRYRERAQGPMLAAASEYFALITENRYLRLLSDDSDGKPILRAVQTDGTEIGIEAMSEGTADQLYLALRLAALKLRRDSHPGLPLVLDDAMITSDDARAARVFKALDTFAENGQVMLFTHHQHLIDIAKEAVSKNRLAVHTLGV
jgi:DNA repair protein SbcC/Rad50